MRVVGVIDLLGGVAVHAHKGARHHYQPAVKTVGGAMTPGDAVALARSYCLELNVDELYVADLDAIMHGRPQYDLVAELASVGLPLWLDAGITSATQATNVLRLGARVVVGLETLPGFDALETICREVNGEQVAFSLDLRNGRPLVRDGSAFGAASVTDLAARAERAGVRTMIVLDLARVGSGSGVDFDLFASVRDAVPGVALMAGGGVRDAGDLTRLASAGCDGALVATALLSGRLQLPFDGRPIDRRT
ncbi:MAG TPA: HisA/HisF-related TIM barrel protein [Vicinamibacterales bacterium]|nr:HisA/HisF-related TIM barrel protein [Vicinamibacterales bacterium]